MAKIYQDALPPETGRAYQIIDNEDGTKKIEDVTKYEQEGSTFGSSDVLETCTLVFEHSKSGTVHNFVNPNSNAKMGRAKMTADIATGDTFQVNGTPVTAYMGTEDATSSMAGSSWTGKWITFVIDGDTLNFKGGGGKVTVSGLSAAAIKTGVTVIVKQGAKTVQTVTGTFTSDADMVASNLVQGKTGYSKGQKIVGTMPPYGPQTIMPTTRDQPFGPGVYLAGQINVKGDSNLVAGNIRQGVSIFGVTGSFTGESDYEVLALPRMRRNLQNMMVSYWNGSSYVVGDATYNTLTVGGVIKKVIILAITGGSICGHSSVGTFTTGHTNTISGVPNIDNQWVSFAVLGHK